MGEPIAMLRKGGRRGVLRHLLVSATLLWAGLSASGCAGSPFNGTVYRSQGFAFRIPAPPSHWRQLDHSDALAFRDDSNQASIMLNGRCGLDGEDVPLQALTNHLFLQFTERKITTQEVVPLDGREAMHTRLDAKLDGVPMSYDIWVLRKDGCVYDMMYFSRPASFDAGHDAFSNLVAQFATLPPDA